MLCDLDLPGVEGFGVARADRDPAIRSAFLVALSSYGLLEDMARSKEAGFDRHVAKPPKMEDLQKRLARVLVRA